LRDGRTWESRRRESEEDDEGDAVTNVQWLLRNELAKVSRHISQFYWLRDPKAT
jgi:hypothetical protein